MPTKAGGGGGNVQTPTLYTPSGFYQALSQLEGIGSYGQSLFNPLSSMTNWAANIATGGASSPIGSYGTEGLVTGPQINIGGQHTPNDQWTTQFDPRTGQVTLTNTMTGEQMQEAWNSPQLQQWFSTQGGGQATLNQWGQMAHQAAKSGGAGTPGGLGPQLQTAWDQIQGIGNTEAETQAWTQNETEQGNQLFGQANQLFKEATTGLGTFPSQTAWIEQGVNAEQEQLQQQLASEGLGSSTAAQILKGEASQQGAATAGQLIQGNISLAQNQYNLAQASQKLALGGQELTLAEQQTMAQLSLGFQSQMWQEALGGYGAMGSLMSTLGNLYGIDLQGYSNLLQSHLQMAQLQAQIQEADQGLQAQAASSMGSGLGSILGLLGGGAGGGAAGGGGGILGSLLGGSGASLGISGTLGSALGGGGAAAGGAGGLLGSLGGLLGSAGSGIGSAVTGLIGLVAAF